MATGLNMFSLVEELSSPAFRKIAALVSPKRGYPELPDYPTIPALPIYIYKQFYAIMKFQHETYQCRLNSRELLMMGREDARNL